jgi:calcineurin-like phosphoesterase family protein
MLYFTSDPHFNHTRIIELCHRPFATTAEMNEKLIENWNATVKNYTDPVYCLCDFAFWYKDAPHELFDLFDRLNGEKHLVIGNHDEQNTRVLRLPWKTKTHLEHVRYGEHRFVLCHFPIERWWHMERGVLHIHGHSHGHAPTRAHRFDAGVDVWDFKPVSAEDVIDIASTEYWNSEEFYTFGGATCAIREP